MLARLVRGWIELRESGRRARPAGPGLCGELRAAQSTMDCARHVRLMVLPGGGGPLVGGLRRPVIFLPAAAEAWPRERLRIALRHELAQVRRGDCAWMLLAGAAQAMVWPHPLVHVAARRMRLASEEACDDAVVSASGVDRRDYARELVEFARTLAAAPTAGATIALVGASQLSRRVSSLLDGQRRRAARRGALTAATLLGLGAIGLAASAAPGRQTAQTPLPRFEAASVKPATVRGYVDDSDSDPLHITITANLSRMIRSAYGVSEQQVGNEPAWFRSRFFTIRAVAGKPSSGADMMLMLRRLLQERFHLVVRDQPRNVPVYLLEVAPGGTRFHVRMPAKPPRRRGYMSGRWNSIAELVHSLNANRLFSVSLRRPVVDRTGLSGNYNIALVMKATLNRAAARDELPNLQRELERQDGLRLVQGHAKLPYYVAVSAAPPTPD